METRHGFSHVTLYALRVERHRRGVTAVEAAIVVGLIGAFLGVASVYHAHLLTQAKELALKADLQSLWAGLAFFQARRGRHPETLEELVVQPIGQVRGSGSQGVWSLQDRGQQLVDSFRNPYSYEPTTGTVRSTTRGYETW